MSKRTYPMEDLIQRGIVVVLGTMFSIAIFAMSVAIGACFASGLLERGHVSAMVTFYVEAIAATACLIATGCAMSGGGAQLMRTMNASGADTLAYLSRHIERYRMGVAICFTGITVGWIGAIVSTPKHPTCIVSAVAAAGALACVLTMQQAWVIVVAGGRYAIVVAAWLLCGVPISLVSLMMAPRIADRLETAGLFDFLLCLNPAHWPVQFAQSLMAGKHETALIWAAAAGLAALGMRLWLRHQLGEPFRRPVAHGTERPVFAPPRDTPQEPDRARTPDPGRWTPPLPASLWIAMRTGGFAGDRIARRLAGVLALWTFLVFPVGAALIIGRWHCSASDIRDFATMWLYSGIGLSLLTALRAHQQANAQDDPTRANRGGRMYPAWAMLPLGPWRTALRRLLVFLGLGLTGLVVLAPLWASTMWLYSAQRPRNGFAEILIAGAMMVICYGGLGITQSVMLPLWPTWWCAFHPMARMALMASTCVGIFVCCVVLPNPLLAALALPLGLLFGARFLYRMWAVDRRAGTDVTEPSRAVSQSR